MIKNYKIGDIVHINPNSIGEILDDTESEEEFKEYTLSMAEKELTICSIEHDHNGICYRVISGMSKSPAAYYQEELKVIKPKNNQQWDN